MCALETVSRVGYVKLIRERAGEGSSGQKGYTIDKSQMTFEKCATLPSVEVASATLALAAD